MYLPAKNAAKGKFEDCRIRCFQTAQKSYLSIKVVLWSKKQKNA